MRYWPLYVMLLPCIVYYALICYVPMAGSVLAFKDYSFKKGIWGSPWVGFDYFKTFFKSYDAGRLIRNTLAIGIIKCILEFPFAIILALLLNELRNMKFKKISQTITYLPHFLSSVIIVTMLQKILAPNTGILNQAIAALGGDGSTFFLMDAKYFYRILFSMDLWKNIGYGSVLYLSVLTGIDQEMYEAADLDGANARQKMWYITLPMLIPMVVVMVLMGLGNIMHSDTGLFYQVTKNSGALYSTTQVLDSYVFNAVMTASNYSTTAATTLYQSVIGCVMMVATNLVVRKVAPENALF